MSSTVCSVLIGTLRFLSPELCQGLVDDKSSKSRCLKLSAALQEYEKSDDLRSAFTYLTTAVGDLGMCYEYLEEGSQLARPEPAEEDVSNNDENLIFYTPDGSKLEGELRKIKSEEKAKKKFERATQRFRECNEECSKICENDSLMFEDRMTATRARLVTEILGNLENLTVAAENSMKIISELHKCQDVISLFIPGHSEQPKKPIWVKFAGYINNTESKNISSVLDISKGVSNFTKRFLRKPVAILDWPVIKDDEHTPASVYHPILGQPLRKPYTTMPDLSSTIECNGFDIDASMSAINCTGEILVVAKDNSSMNSSVMRIADGALHLFWRLNKEAEAQEESKEELQIISISVECENCSVKLNQNKHLHTNCKNKLYVLASYKSDEKRLFKMFVIDFQGNLQYDVKLTCLPPRNVFDEVCCKILCTHTKVIIFDIKKREAYLCDASGELEKPLPNVAKCMPSLTTASADEEIIILEKPNKLHFVNNINNESSVNTTVIDGCNEVVGMTFNHVLNEVNILSKAGSKEYHFKCFSKVGELRQDIKLREDKHHFWKNATLISHPSGRLVMFDNKQMLNLH